MRKYLGTVTIPVLLVAYWIYKSFIEGTETGAMPLLMVVYIIVFICWLFSYRGFWKTFSAFILIAIPAVFILFTLVLFVSYLVA
ncbi:hypothetical protein KFZ56_05905 [Virgibacillus sp. NKC19-3]|uniref:hypothetical protein n=1 Tax=Virgibacillus saliphilus TaxID=2831674 RepID=UPI001C9B4490|nr:hypothetical protein [Virgibacillus sp. NKC19-3]MBY7142620.1 hypothetical protein [Virgibacillus sp. NKC19-3]